MKEYVVDASVAAKWFLDEAGQIEADALSCTGDRLIAPSFVLIELANIFWKQQRRAIVDKPEIIHMLAKAPLYFSELVDSTALISAALNIACAHQHPVYDCLYLALALERDCAVVTADHKLISRFAATAFSGQFLPLTGFAP